MRITDKGFELRHGQDGCRQQFASLREITIAGYEPVSFDGECTGEKLGISLDRADTPARSAFPLRRWPFLGT